MQKGGNTFVHPKGEGTGIFIYYFPKVIVPGLLEEGSVGPSALSALLVFLMDGVEEGKSPEAQSQDVAWKT